GGESTQPGAASRVVASGVGGHSNLGASTTARPRGTARRVGGGGIRGGRGADRHGGRARGTLDRTPLAGAVAGLCTGPGGSPGTSAGEGHGSGVGADRTQAGEEEAVPRGVDARGRGHRGTRGGGGLAELHGEGGNGGTPKTCQRNSSDAAGGGRVVRDRGASGEGADRVAEAGDGLAGIRDQRADVGVDAGGVGLPGSVPNRGRLVTPEGAVAGPDAAGLAGRGPHPGTGVPVECRVACAESGGVGGTRAIAKGEDEVAGRLRGPTGPSDGPPQCGTAAEGDASDRCQANSLLKLRRRKVGKVGSVGGVPHPHVPTDPLARGPRAPSGREAI